MFDTFGGIPLHPLVIHAVVVLAPLTALLLLVYVLRPAWRGGLRWPLVGMAAISAVCAFVATQSGEALEHMVGDPAYDHAEKGDLAAISVYVLFGAVLAVVLVFARASATRMSAMALIVALMASGFLGYAVFEAGHTGAKSVWHDVAKASKTTDGTDGGDGDTDGD